MSPLSVFSIHELQIARSSSAIEYAESKAYSEQSEPSEPISVDVIVAFYNLTEYARHVKENYSRREGLVERRFIMDARYEYNVGGVNGRIYQLLTLKQVNRYFVYTVRHWNKISIDI
jgi:hypothetical protein